MQHRALSIRHRALRTTKCHGHLVSFFATALLTYRYSGRRRYGPVRPSTHCTYILRGSSFRHFCTGYNNKDAAVLGLTCPALAPPRPVQIRVRPRFPQTSTLIKVKYTRPDGRLIVVNDQPKTLTFGDFRRLFAVPAGTHKK